MNDSPVTPRAEPSPDEYAKMVFDKGVAWIASADSKAAGLISLLGVILGLITIGISGGAAPAPLHKFLFVLFVALALASVLASVLVLWPRVKRKSLLPKDSALSFSPTFFADIAGMTFDRFRDLSAAPPSESLKKDAVEQAYILACIANRKMFWMRIAVVLSALSLASLGALALAAGRVI